MVKSLKHYKKEVESFKKRGKTLKELKAELEIALDNAFEAEGTEASPIYMKRFMAIRNKIEARKRMPTK